MVLSMASIAPFCPPTRWLPSSLSWVRLRRSFITASRQSTAACLERLREGTWRARGTCGGYKLKEDGCNMRGDGTAAVMKANDVPNCSSVEG